MLLQREREVNAGNVQGRLFSWTASREGGRGALDKVGGPAMKKEKLKKIVLSKETLRRLEEGEVRDINAGAYTLWVNCTNSCFNSCPPTCDC
jgi:hypothetical protein